MAGFNLVADVGGTNCRIGLSQNGLVLRDSVNSYRNDEYSCFDDALRAYLDEHEGVAINSANVALAGPVAGGSGTLTNRDWHFDAQDLSEKFNIRFHLLNDLTALGHSVTALRDDDLTNVWIAPDESQNPTQSLVIGIGTGFNVSPVRYEGERSVALVVEAGHCGLPIDVATRLRALVDHHADEFPTVEHLFSGRGYHKMLSLIDDQEALDCAYLEMAAHQVVNMLKAYKPTRGIYLAGGVIRNLLQKSNMAAHFAKSYEAVSVIPLPYRPSISLIVDDYAALKGCAQRL